MSSLHPRRNAREGVLEALFAQEFSEEKPKVVLNRVLDSNPARKKIPSLLRYYSFVSLKM